MIPLLLARLHQIFAGSEALRYVTLPAGAALTVLTGGIAYTFGAWAQLAASVGAADVWLCGIHMANPSLAVDYEVDIGIGGGGAETTRAQVDFSVGYLPLQYPIRLPAASRLAARSRDATGAGTCAVKAQLITGV